MSTRPAEPAVSGRHHGLRAGPPRAFPLTVCALLLTALLLFPIYWLVAAAVETTDQLLHYPPYLVPPSLDVGAFQRAWTAIAPHMLTSVIISAGTIVISLLLATPAAFAMAHLRLRITMFFVFLLLVTQMFPTIMLGTPLYILYFHLNLLDTYQGLILANAINAVPFTILVLRAYIGTIPYEIIEAAKMDGLGEWGAFLRVIVPLTVPGLITAAIFNFLFAWGDFALARTLTLKETIQPATLALYTYISSNSTDWSGLLAASVLTAAPAALVLLAAQRYISAGLTSGAVKL